MRKLALLAATAFVAIGMSAPAQALTYLGTFTNGPGGNGCGPGPLANCWATQTGLVQLAAGATPTDPLASIGVYKYGDPSEVGAYSSITGSEFSVTLSGNLLSFTYTPDPNDPALHYFAVKQADVGYALFYDLNPITSVTNLNLSTYFPNNPGYSHVDFFDGGSSVPEPATWAMMLLGFGAAGFSIRRSKRKALLTQIA